MKRTLTAALVAGTTLLAAVPAHATDGNLGFTAPFTDIGTNDSHTCTWNFDDGTPSSPEP